MTKPEIEHLKRSHKKGIYNRTDKIWIKAFEEYNLNNRPLSMGCRPCYPKVLKYLEDRL